MIYLLAIFVFNSLMILMPSTGMSVSILKSTTLSQANALDTTFKMSPLPSSFKWQLYFLLCCCGAGMVATEVALFKLFQLRNGRSFWRELADKIRDYVCFPILRAFSRGKFFKFRSVAEQATDIALDAM
jgi:hypothetical protein